MNFLRPEFLFALPLVALPVIIHLLNRRRYVVVEFGAIEFLRRAMKKTRRRLLLEDILLLLLRTLAVLALILGLAHPGATPELLSTGRAARAEVVVLDASLSMSHRDAGASAYERGVSEAVRRLRELNAERGDRAAAIIAGLQAERIAYGDPDEVRTAVEERDRPDPGRGSLGVALTQARKTAASLSAEGPEFVRVTILTDLQATSWDLNEGEGEAVRAIAADGFPLTIVDVGAIRRHNTAVTALQVEPAEISAGEFAEARVLIRNFSDESRGPLRASLFVDGVPAAHRELSLAAGEEVGWNHPIAPAQEGQRAIEVRLEGDSMSLDDRRAFVLRVRPPPKVLLVGDEAAVGQADTVFDSVRRFLDLGEEAPLDLRLAAPGRLDRTTLESSDVLVLADSGRLPSANLPAVEEFVLRGGGLLLLAGRESTEGATTPLIQLLGDPALRLGPVATAGDYHARLRILDEDHPALSFFRDPAWRPLLTEVPFQRYRVLRLEEDSDLEPQLRVPLRFVRGEDEERLEDQGAAMVEWTYGAGRCAVVAAAPDSLWNQMPSVVAGTLPFLFDLLTHLTPRPGHRSLLEVGEALEAELPHPPTEVALTHPDGRTTHPDYEAVLLPGERARQPLLDSANQLGVWDMRARILDRDGAEQVHDERFAVVAPADESQLEPVSPDQLEALLPPDTKLIRPGEEEEDRDFTDLIEPERDLSHYFYWMVAAFLITETLLAAFLDRRRG